MGLGDQVHGCGRHVVDLCGQVDDRLQFSWWQLLQGVERLDPGSAQHIGPELHAGVLSLCWHVLIRDTG
jgi:hypothetical protein